MKTKRTTIKDITQTINLTKGEIDKLKSRLDKKEEERKMQSKAQRNEMQMDFDDDIPF